MKRPIRILVAATAAVLLPLAALADGAEVVAVLATGHGVDPAAAKKAAGRAAIEQVVGQLVDAETLVENDELVKDRILTYSGAYLEDLEVVGSPSQADGLWTVKVLAKVRKTQLAQKLRAENVGTVALKKGKLFAQAASRAQEAEDAAAMVKAAFDGFPKNVVRFNVCKNDAGTPAISVVDADGNVAVDVELGIDPAAWKEWARNLISKLEKVAAKAEDAIWKSSEAEVAERLKVLKRTNPDFPTQPFSQSEEGNRLYVSTWYAIEFFRRWPSQDKSGTFRVAVVSSIRPGSSGFAAKEFELSGNNEAALRDVFWKSIAREIQLTVSLMADDELLDSRTFTLDAGSGAAVYSNWGGCVAMPSNANYCFLPALCRWPGDDHTKFIPSGRVRLSLGRMSPAVLADATDIRTSVRFFVAGPSTRNTDQWELVPLED